MLYYDFICDNCQDQRTFDDRQTIEHLVTQGYHQCGICDHRTTIDQSRIYEDDLPDEVESESSIDYSFPSKKDDLPTLRDMSVIGLDREDLEPWQDYIFQEFESSQELTYDPKATYDTCLQELKSHQFGWVKFGVWAFHFKLKRFYRNHHKTWKQFCEKVLHQSHWYIDKLIKAARVIKDLIDAGFTVLPQNEYQCRPLTKFWGDELIDNWSMIVDAVEPHLITSDLIKSRFNTKKETEEKWIKVNSERWEEFEYKARQKGLNPHDVIDAILDNWEDTEDTEDPEYLADDDIEEVSPEKLEVWQQDLKDLIAEKNSQDCSLFKLIFWSLFNDQSLISGLPYI